MVKAKHMTIWMRFSKIRHLTHFLISLTHNNIKLSKHLLEMVLRLTLQKSCISMSFKRKKARSYRLVMWSPKLIRSQKILKTRREYTLGMPHRTPQRKLKRTISHWMLWLLDISNFQNMIEMHNFTFSWQVSFSWLPPLSLFLLVVVFFTSW